MEFHFYAETRSRKEHHGSPCDGSVKSAGPLCCHTQMGNNQAHRTKCLWQDVGTISTGMLFITRGRGGLTHHLHSEAPAGNRRMAMTFAKLRLIVFLRSIGLDWMPL